MYVKYLYKLLLVYRYFTYNSLFWYYKILFFREHLPHAIKWRLQ